MTDFTQHQPATSSNFWPANLGVHIFHTFLFSDQMLSGFTIWCLSLSRLCGLIQKESQVCEFIFIFFLRQAHSCMCMHAGVGGTAHVSKNCNCLLLMVASRQFLTYCPSFLYFSLCILCVLLQSAVRIIFFMQVLW